MTRPIVSDNAMKAWDDAYAYKALIEHREAERGQMIPMLTIRALLAWSSCWAVVLHLSGGMAS